MNLKKSRQLSDETELYKALDAVFELLCSKHCFCNNQVYERQVKTSTP